MVKLTEAVVNFLEAQGCVAMSTIDQEGFPHSSCKDIIKIDKEGRVYLLDAYQGVTLRNLMRNPASNITAFDEHKFAGYCLKGKARVISREDLTDEIVRAWEARISIRVARRLVSNLKGDKPRSQHPEASLSQPRHMIILEVEKIVNLSLPSEREDNPDGQKRKNI